MNDSLAGHLLLQVALVEEDALSDAGCGRKLVGPRAVDEGVHEVGLGVGVVCGCVQYVVSSVLCSCRVWVLVRAVVESRQGWCWLVVDVWCWWVFAGRGGVLSVEVVEWVDV
eukprot:3401085-Pyramimonas_sp.AAC.1